MNEKELANWMERENPISNWIASIIAKWLIKKGLIKEE